MSERYKFEVRAEDTKFLLACGGEYPTATDAEREGRHYALQYAMGGEPCTLSIRRVRRRKAVTPSTPNPSDRSPREGREG